VAESSQETPPPGDNITESPKGLEIHSDWHTAFMIYLRTWGLPEDKVKREQLRNRTGQYTLVNDELFWQSINDTLLKCVTLDKGCAIL
jgi:hypothetical protein